MPAISRAGWFIHKSLFTRFCAGISLHNNPRTLEIIIAVARYLIHIYRNTHTGCTQVVAQWCTMAQPRPDRGRGRCRQPSVASKQMLALPSTVSQSGATPRDHLRCSRIPILDQSEERAGVRGSVHAEKQVMAMGGPALSQGRLGVWAARGLPGDWLLFNVKVTSETASAMCRIWPQGPARHTDSLSMIDITGFLLRYSGLWRWRNVKVWPRELSEGTLYVWFCSACMD